MTSDTTVSTHPKASGRLAHSRSFLLSDVSATRRAADMVSSATAPGVTPSNALRALDHPAVSS
jgi:hypothetical protein